MDGTTQQHLIDEAIADGRAPATAGQMARILRMAWRWGGRIGHCPVRELGRAELPRPERRYRHYTPTATEAEAIVDALTGWPRILGELLWATGGRVGEIATLTWDQVDMAAGAVVLDGKTGRREVPIGLGVVAQLGAWRAQDLAGPYVLGVRPLTARQAGRVAIIRACQQLQIRETTPHGFRRLAATELIGARVDERTYEGLMGHSYQMGVRLYAQARACSVREAAARLGRRDRGQVVEGPWTARG